MSAKSDSATILVALVVAALCVGTAIQCERTGSLAVDGASPAGEGQREAANELRLRHNNRLLAVPYSLARFLAHNARAGGAPERATLSSQAGDSGGRQIGGHKRSSSALDALTGVTLGKRSTNPLEFVNFEPVFGRQNFARGPPRVYDMRWAPVDSIEAPSSYADYSK